MENRILGYIDTFEKIVDEEVIGKGEIVTKYNENVNKITSEKEKLQEKIDKEKENLIDNEFSDIKPILDEGKEEELTDFEDYKDYFDDLEYETYSKSKIQELIEEYKKEEYKKEEQSHVDEKKVNKLFSFIKEKLNVLFDNEYKHHEYERNEEIFNKNKELILQRIEVLDKKINLNTENLNIEYSKLETELEKIGDKSKKDLLKKQQDMLETIDDSSVRICLINVMKLPINGRREFINDCRKVGVETADDIHKVFDSVRIQLIEQNQIEEQERQAKREGDLFRSTHCYHCKNHILCTDKYFLKGACGSFIPEK